MRNVGLCLVASLAMGLASARPAPAGDDVYHVGYQNECMVEHPDVGSFFDGDIWYDFAPPTAEDNALFGSGFDPQGNGLRPHVLLFGEFCWQVPDCPEPRWFDAGEGLAASLWFLSEDWTFYFGSGRVGECGPPGWNPGRLTVTEGIHIGQGEGSDAGLTLIGGPMTAGQIDVGVNGGTGRLTLYRSDRLTAGSVGVGIDGGTGDLTFDSGELRVGNIQIGAGEAPSHAVLTLKEESHLVETAYEDTQIGGGHGTSSAVVDLRYWGDIAEFNGDLYVCRGPGAGSLNIGEGAHVSVDGALVIASEGPGARGSVSVGCGGGSLDVAGDLIVGGMGPEPVGSMGLCPHRSFVTSRTGILGLSETAVGSVGVTGHWSIGEALVVGAAGEGHLAISDFGEVTAGWVVIGDQPGSWGGIGLSEWGWIHVRDTFVVGRQGHGVFALGNESDVTASSLIIGEQPGGNGEVLHPGDYSICNIAGPIEVGSSGSGILEIGGAMQSVTGTVASRPGSTGRVTIKGRDVSWTITESLDIGVGGEGSVSVLDRAELTAPFIVIGELPQSEGTLEVSDDGTIVKGLSTVGEAGHGTMTVLDGGHVSSADPGTGQARDAYVGLADGGVGEVTIQDPGTRWDGINILTLGGAEAEATLTLENGGTASATMTQIGPRGLATGTGLLTGDVTNGGRIEPGLPIGQLEVAGDFRQAPEGTLIVELAGPTVDKEYDVLVVTGPAALDGTLDVHVVQKFTPQHGQRFDVMTCLGRQGQFTDVRTPDLDELRLIPRYEEDRVSLLTISNVNCEDVTRFKVRCSSGTLKAKTTTALPHGTKLLIDNNAVLESVTVNRRGKGKAVFENQTGEHTVAIVECPQYSKMVNCD